MSQSKEPPDSLAAGPGANGTHLAGTSSRYVLERIGSYRVLGIIGEGAMGVVYDAEQDRPHRRVALKVIRPGLTGDTHLLVGAPDGSIRGNVHPVPTCSAR